MWHVNNSPSLIDLSGIAESVFRQLDIVPLSSSRLHITHARLTGCFLVAGGRSVTKMSPSGIQLIQDGFQMWLHLPRSPNQ